MASSSNVTLSENARRLCAKLGVPESGIKQARAGSTGETERPEWLVVYGELPDGRRVRMMCPHHIPHHVVTWRPLPPV
jgi:hypothetical protein